MQESPEIIANYPEAVTGPEQQRAAIVAEAVGVLLGATAGLAEPQA